MPGKILAIFIVFIVGSANAEVLTIKITDKDGKTVPEAVVMVNSQGADSDSISVKEGLIDQIDKEFIKYVTVVQVGTAVYFPNHDKIRHHVYSFSEAKNFEIPLYEGMPEHPVVFDKPGIVSLGCNIHDWMQAYVYVTDAPYYALTGDDGTARINLPVGEYAVEAWHPRLKESIAGVRNVKIEMGKNSDIAIAMNLKKSIATTRAPSTSGLVSGYR